MKWSTSIGAVLAWVAVILVGTGEPARVARAQSSVRTRSKASKVLVHVNDVAHQFGWKVNVVEPGRMIALCREGENELCVPVRLEGVETLDTADGLFIEAEPLARALQLRVETDGDQVRFVRSEPKVSDSDVPPYHAHWKEGRGFQVGQTLPDIPLFDLDGQEVRFSRFLGKQYIIYCWASW